MYTIILIFLIWFLLPTVMSRRFIHVIPYKISSSFSTAPQNEYTRVYLSILPLMHVVFIYFGATVNNILLCMHVSFDGYKNLFLFSLMCSKAYMFLISANIAKNPFGVVLQIYTQISNLTLSCLCQHFLYFLSFSSEPFSEYLPVVLIFISLKTSELTYLGILFCKVPY